MFGEGLKLGYHLDWWASFRISKPLEKLNDHGAHK
jgi:hypothetical protein